MRAFLGNLFGGLLKLIFDLVSSIGVEPKKFFFLCNSNNNNHYNIQTYSFTYFFTSE